MTESILTFLMSAAVIIVAGAALSQFGDLIAHRSRLGGLLVGSILIAGATSLPELAIDIHALRLESADMAVGDLVGSSLFNLMILAVLDLTRYSGGRLLSERSAGHALAAGTSIALTGIVGVFILLGPTLSEVTFLRLGPGSFVVVAAYALGVRLIFHGRQKPASDASAEEIESVLPKLRRLGLKGAVIGYVLTAVMILVAAPFLARAAKDLAEQTGLGGTFFGTTFVALCTSLPEMVTTFVAVRMNAFDLALGNIFGSNCFNMLAIAPLDLVDAGPLLSSVSPAHAYTAFAVIVVTSVAMLGQLYRVERKKPILEPDAWLVLTLVAAALTGLYFVQT